jgi:hypothetical protein
MGKALELAPPEYVLPVGISYNDCFTQGNCSADILQQIYDAKMGLEIIYLKVIPPALEGQWVRLRVAGPGWSPANATTEHSSGGAQPYQRALLPLIAGEPRSEKPQGCPCARFDNVGRMLELVPGDDEGQ